MSQENQLVEEIKRVRELREKKTELSRPIKILSEELDQAETRVLELLKESGMKTVTTEFGRATLVMKPSVRIPESPEDMHKFLEFAKEKYPDLYYAKVCMKSTDINGLYELVQEDAVAKGLDDFSVPGVGGISYRETLSFTKG